MHHDLSERLSYLRPHRSILQGTVRIGTDQKSLPDNALFSPISYRWIWNTRTPDLHITANHHFFRPDGRVISQGYTLGPIASPDRFMPEEEVSIWVRENVLEDDDGLMPRVIEDYLTPLIDLEPVADAIDAAVLDDLSPSQIVPVFMSSYSSRTGGVAHLGEIEMFNRYYRPFIDLGLFQAQRKWYDIPFTLRDQRTLQRLTYLCQDCLGQQFFEDFYHPHADECLVDDFYLSCINARMITTGLSRNLNSILGHDLTWGDVFKDVDLRPPR